MAHSINRTTGAAAINIAFAGGTVTGGTNVPWVLHNVRVHLSAAGGAVENLTITVDGGVVAAVYDTLLLTQAMAAVTDIVYTPDAPLTLDPTDVLDIAYANTNTRTYGVEIEFTQGA